MNDLNHATIECPVGAGHIMTMTTDKIHNKTINCEQMIRFDGLNDERRRRYSDRLPNLIHSQPGDGELGDASRSGSSKLKETERTRRLQSETQNNEQK